MLHAVLPRCHAGGLLEENKEVLHVFYAQLFAQLHDLDVRFNQQPFGLLNAGAVDIIGEMPCVWRKTRHR